MSKWCIIECFACTPVIKGGADFLRIGERLPDRRHDVPDVEVPGVVLDFPDEQRTESLDGSKYLPAHLAAVEIDAGRQFFYFLRPRVELFRRRWRLVCESRHDRAGIVIRCQMLDAFQYIIFFIGDDDVRVSAHDFKDEYTPDIIPDLIAGLDMEFHTPVVADLPDAFDDAAFDVFSRNAQEHRRIEREFIFLFRQMETCIHRVCTDQEIMSFPLRADFEYKGCTIHLLDFIDLAFFQY